MSGMTAIKQLTERAGRLELRNKQRIVDEKVTTDKLVGFGSAFLTSVLAGYVDGRFDVSGKDTVSGDGTRVFGIPVVPVAAGLIAVGGLAVGGRVGSAMAYSALGAACGWSYSAAANKGREADVAKTAQTTLEDE